jgi:ankyrin repeat protein
MLIGHQADINLQNSQGDTPLHVACANDLVEVIKILMDVGARRDIANRNGDLPVALVDSEEAKRLFDNP